MSQYFKVNTDFKWNNISRYVAIAKALFHLHAYVGEKQLIYINYNTCTCTAIVAS